MTSFPGSPGSSSGGSVITESAKHVLKYLDMFNAQIGEPVAQGPFLTGSPDVRVSSLEIRGQINDLMKGAANEADQFRLLGISFLTASFVSPFPCSMNYKSLTGNEETHKLSDAFYYKQLHHEVTSRFYPCLASFAQHHGLKYGIAPPAELKHLERVVEISIELFKLKTDMCQKQSRYEQAVILRMESEATNTRLAELKTAQTEVLEGYQRLNREWALEMILGTKAYLSSKAKGFKLGHNTADAGFPVMPDLPFMFANTKAETKITVGLMEALEYEKKSDDDLDDGSSWDVLDVAANKIVATLEIIDQNPEATTNSVNLTRDFHLNRQARINALEKVLEIRWGRRAANMGSISPVQSFSALHSP